MSCPEKNLWFEVIRKLLEDAEIEMIKAARYQKLYGCVGMSNHDSIIYFYRTLRSPWLFEMCSWVDLHPDHLINVLKKLEKKHGIYDRKIVPQSEFKTIYDQSFIDDLTQSFDESYLQKILNVSSAKHFLELIDIIGKKNFRNILKSKKLDEEYLKKIKEKLDYERFKETG